MKEVIAVIHDDRKAPFFWVTPKAMGVIRTGVGAGKEGEKDPGLSQVTAVYVALVELANEKRARPDIGVGSAAFSAERKRIATYAGASTRTVSRATATLERIGLLRMEYPERQAREHLPTGYVLLEPEDDPLLPESQQGQAGAIARESTGLLPQGQPTTSRRKTTKKKKEAAAGEKKDRKAEADSHLLGAAVGSSTVPAEPDPAAAVWNHYVRTFDRSGRATELQSDDRRLIEEALEVGDVGELQAAVTACEGSDWHMKRGEHANRSGGRHSSLATILRPKRNETWRSRLDGWLERRSEQTSASVPAFDPNAEMARIRKAQGLDT
jgi:hypothetical protein